MIRRGSRSGSWLVRSQYPRSRCPSTRDPASATTSSSFFLPTLRSTGRPGAPGGPGGFRVEVLCRSGLYGRYQPNFVTGNGQAWAGTYADNTFAGATPWFVDRPPLAMGEFKLPPLPDGGAKSAILASGGNTTAVLTKNGFVAQRQDVGIVDAFSFQGGLLGLTNAGELEAPLEGTVYARVDLDPFPSQAELHVVSAPRADGGSEWVVSVDDQVFAGTRTYDGRIVSLVAAARPAPGFSIISLAAPLDHAGPDQAEFYAATRVSVFRVHLDALNRWRVDELKLGTDADFLEVWVTPGRRVRAADRSGAVYSLPRGLQLARKLPGAAAQDYLTTCGRDFMLTATDAYVLGAADAGIAQWEPQGLTPDSFVTGRMFAINNGLIVFGSRGEAQRINCLP